VQVRQNSHVLTVVWEKALRVILIMVSWSKQDCWWDGLSRSKVHHHPIRVMGVYDVTGRQFCWTPTFI